MIDSGTLGPKGHIQAVIPFKSESYSSMKDPEDNTEIPFCTLKMFPEETLHCVEWAKDLFSNQFTLDAQSYNKLMFDDDEEIEMQEIKNAQKVLSMFIDAPKDFKDCLAKARTKF